MKSLKEIFLEKIHGKNADLTEMAASYKFSGGAFGGAQGKQMVKAFKDGQETYEFKNGDTYKFVKSTASNKLEKGMVVMASYNSTNQGAQIYEIKGFSDAVEKYGESGVKFDSIDAVFKANKVKNLKDLMALEDKNEYGRHTYLVVKDLEDGDEGAWFYLYKGSWCRGSGAEKLTFYIVEKV